MKFMKFMDWGGQVAEFLYDILGRLSEKRLFSPNPNVGGGGLDGSLPPVGSSGDSCDFSHIPSATPDEVISFGYDALGRQSQISENVGASTGSRLTSFSYDPDGRLISLSSPEGTVFYEYDPVTGRKERTFTANSDVLYHYDELGRLSAVSVLKQNGIVLTEPQVTTYEYTDVGTRAAIDYPNNTRTEYTYDSLNRLTKLTNLSGVGFQPASQVLSSYEYSLSPNGHRTAVTETRLESDDTYSTTGIQWTYDGLNRLIREASGSDLPEANYTTDYVYDLVGNRLSKSSNVLNPSTSSLEPETFTYNYNSNDQLLEESFSSYNVGGTPSAESRLTTYDYDPNGSLISKLEEDATSNQTLATSNYSYSLDNRLSSAEITRTETVNNVDHQVAIATSYLYNQSGIRVRSNSTTSVNSGPSVDKDTVFLLDSNNHTGYAQVLEEYSPTFSTAPSLSYTIGDDIIAQSTPSAFSLQPSYFHYDGHGSTRLLTDSSGTITDRYSYDAFGILVKTTFGVLNTPRSSFLFSGEMFDVELQQQYLRARYYDQNIGRFNQLDPMPLERMASDNSHRYAYVSSDPVNKHDPTGLYEEDVHFYFTYFVLRYLGLTDVQAQTVSWADQHVDEDRKTKPFALSLRQRQRFHFPHAKGGSVQPNDLMVRAALQNAVAEGNLIKVGILLHTYQDTWAHQQFSAYAGHLLAGHAPDRQYLPDNQIAAEDMANNVFEILKFLPGANAALGFNTFWKDDDLQKTFFYKSSNQNIRIGFWILLIKGTFFGGGDFPNSVQAGWFSSFRTEADQIKPWYDFDKDTPRDLDPARANTPRTFGDGQIIILQLPF